MEAKIYELLGIKYYRKLVLYCKSKFNKHTKTHDNDNYFLRGHSREDIIFLGEQFRKNLKKASGGPAGILLGRSGVRYE